METFICEKGCCIVKVNPYNVPKDPLDKVRKKRRKAGVFIFDPIENRVLLVQSRGHLWGPPKGTLNYAETERKCAIREVKEETGLIISEDDFTRSTCIHNRAIYFFSERKACDISIQDHIPDNDANGITWIKPECLTSCIENGNISLSKHCRIVFYRFMGMIFPHSAFVLIEKKGQSARF